MFATRVGHFQATFTYNKGAGANTLYCEFFFITVDFEFAIYAAGGAIASVTSLVEEASSNKTVN
jgi:hypothetical protein